MQHYHGGIVTYGLFTPSKVLLWVLGSSLLGFAFPIVQLRTLSIGVLTVCLILALYFSRSRQTSCIAFMLAAYFSSSIYFNWYFQRISPVVEYGKRQTFQITVLDNPAKSGDTARYLGQMPEGWQTTIILQRGQEIPPGSLVTLEGTLSPIDKERNPGYYFSQVKNKTFADLRYPEIIKIEDVQLSTWQRLVIESRKRFSKTIHQLFLDPQAGLFAGILAGIKSDLPKDLLDSFKITGLSHLIAVSGYNITIIMKLFADVTRRFNRFWHLNLSLLLIIFFVIFTGGSASVVRAGILAGLFVLARVLGRRASLLRLLIIVAFLMALQNPLIVRYDIGFQLSFAAVVGLALYADYFTSLLKRSRLPDFIHDTLAATMAAQLTTWPIIAYHFGSMSLYSLPANLLVGPLIPLITLFGIPFVFLGMIHPLLVSWLGGIFDLTLRYITYMAQMISKLPHAAVTVEQLPIVILICYYIVLLSTILLLPKVRHDA